MIISLLIGTILGIALALPPGPVGITAIKFGLSRGSKPGTELALGNAILDFFYSFVMIFATSAATLAVSSFADTYPYISTIIQISVVLVFLAAGIWNLSSTNTNFDYNNPDTAFNSRFFTLFKKRGPILLGAAIALTNLANPTFIPALALISMKVHSLNLFENNFLNNFSYAIGFGLGNFLWITILVKSVIKYKHKLSENMLLRIRQFAGFTFLSFGTILGYRVFTITKWTEFIRFILAF